MVPQSRPKDCRRKAQKIRKNTGIPDPAAPEKGMPTKHTKDTRGTPKAARRTGSLSAIHCPHRTQHVGCLAKPCKGSLDSLLLHTAVSLTALKSTLRVEA